MVTNEGVLTRMFEQLGFSPRRPQDVKMPAHRPREVRQLIPVPLHRV